MEENKNEEVVNEQTSEVSTEKKSDGYHLIMDNFKPAVILACILVGLFIISKLLGIFVSGNLPWTILNVILFIAYAAIGVLELLLCLKKAKPAMNKDIATFIVSLVAAILSFLAALECAINGTNNLLGFINEIMKK